MLHRVQMAGHHIMIWKWTRLLVQCARPTITIISRNWQSCSPEKMHLHQKDKIQSLLNVLRPQPNPEQVVVNIFRHSPLLYYFPFLTRMEGGVDDILFIRRPWSWTVATTSRLTPTWPRCLTNDLHFMVGIQTEGTGGHLHFNFGAKQLSCLSSLIVSWQRKLFTGGCFRKVFLLQHHLYSALQPPASEYRFSE